MTSCSLKNGIKAKMCPRLRDDDTYVPPAQYEKDPFLRHQARVDSSTCEILTEIIEFFNVYSVRSVSRSIFLVSQRGATPLETTGDWSQQQSCRAILRAPSAPAAWIRKPFGTSPSLFLASQRIHPPWIKMWSSSRHLFPAAQSLLLYSGRRVINHPPPSCVFSDFK